MEEEDLTAIRWAFREWQFLLRPHAYVEMRLDRFTTEDIRRAGSESELLEDYPDRP